MLDTATTRAHLQHSLRISAGPIAERLKTHTTAAERAAVGLWRRDPSVWSDDPAVHKKIANRLGWLDSPRAMARLVDHVRDFAEEIRREGFTDVVLLGMGGSSLAPEVLRAVIGVAPGWPRFHMLDSTDPAAVRAVATPPERTLFLLASKSGTTIEPNSLAAHFRQTLETAAAVPRWADHFVAITDEGTALSTLARTERFREVFVNPSDIGGRYSALSLFGLVPAALMGQDIGAMVSWGVALLSTAEFGEASAAGNPAVGLGLMMGAAAIAGRDKMTLIVPPLLEPFGLWIEQLVAESTGKHGVGIVPIVGETPAPAPYPADRFFVRMKIGVEEVGNWEAADQPVADIDVPEPSALGAEFLRWEIATAVAGALLHINPFDEPNVQQAKDATRVLLEHYKEAKALPTRPPDKTDADGVTFTLSTDAKAGLALEPDAFLTLVEPDDYVALLAYVGPDTDLAEALRALRMGVRDRTRAATMFGYGPRYLHSTGQLHKGGPNSGVFVLVTAAPTTDLPIPGEPFSFGTLELAQALGDFNSLADTGRRALHVHLPSPDVRLLRRLCDTLLSHLAAPRSA